MRILPINNAADLPIVYKDVGRVEVDMDDVTRWVESILVLSDEGLQHMKQRRCRCGVRAHRIEQAKSITAVQNGIDDRARPVLPAIKRLPALDQVQLDDAWHQFGSDRLKRHAGKQFLNGITGCRKATNHQIPWCRIAEGAQPGDGCTNSMQSLDVVGLGSVLENTTLPHCINHGISTKTTLAMRITIAECKTGTMLLVHSGQKRCWVHNQYSTIVDPVLQHVYCKHVRRQIVGEERC